MDLSMMTGQVKTKFGQFEKTDDDFILQALSEGVCLISADRKVSFANRSAVRMLDYEEAGQLIGRNYDLVFFHRDKTRVEEELAVCPIQFALVDGASSQINSETFFQSNGKSLLVEYRCTPIFENEQITGVVVTFEDISERRDVELVITAAREAALEAARAKAAFLANMSHEIRTPLSGIVGTTNLLFETNLTDEQREYLQTLQKSVELLMETVNDILDLSKIEAGKLKLDTADFNLRELLDETISLFKISANKKNIGLNFTIEESAPENLRGDANRLRQILNNLLSNAVKFTEAGEIRIKVSNSNNTQKRLLFEVFDTGIGISEAQKRQLFQPFSQADLSTARRFGGTGLGLAICREIVELMGGEINVESETNRGSRFWFTVDLVPGSKFQSLSPVKQTILNGKHGKLKILIAEDDAVNREITSKMLIYLGYQTEAAENGIEAIRKAQEKEFDLILMDCRMPEIDGFTAAEVIRAGGETTHRPKIIALTAYSAKAERERCFASGMDDYLQKPVTKNDLINILNQHFSPEKLALNLDLEENFGQHSLAEIITPDILQNLLTIESRGEKNFVFEILQIFCENAEKQITALKADLQKQDAKSIARRAHSLKGSSANVGLEKLTTAFENLQASAVFENWTQIVVLFAEIMEEFESIKSKVFEMR